VVNVAASFDPHQNSVNLLVMQLKVQRVLSSQQRISSVDIFRGLAIVAVVIFHYGTFLPLGFLGVDLFFVISGLLVGGILTREFLGTGNVDYRKFILRRGLKIWPSYYAFLFVGNGVAYLLYRDTYPDYVIPAWDLPRYVFFFQNYSGLPYHIVFDHVWSLCVEEHFYLLLPLLFLFIQFSVKSGHRVRYLIYLVCLTILTGICMKFCSFYFTRSQDTYSATHNRIDALAWGVLLYLILHLRGDQIKKQRGSFFYFIGGVALFVVTLIIRGSWENVIFNKVIFHSIVPFSFFLMILGVYYIDFSRLRILRVIAYFSYNWYLWHVLLSTFIFDKFGDQLTGLVIYMASTFLIAVVATILIEEAVLAKRDKIFAPKSVQ